MTWLKHDIHRLHSLSHRSRQLLGEPRRGMVGMLTAASTALCGCRTVEEMAATAVHQALELIPTAQHAGLVLLAPPERARPAAWSSEMAFRFDSAQLAAQAGPLVEALEGRTPVRAHHLHDQAWLAQSDEYDNAPRSVFAVPLTQGERRWGALSVYGNGPALLDEKDELVAVALAGHVSIWLSWNHEITTLRQAIATRQVIGEAMGILVERHHLTPEEAYDILARRSQDINVKLREIARTVVATGQDPSDIVGP